MRIPTILGLIIIILGLFLGILYFYTTQKSSPASAIVAQPQSIQVINLSDTSATVTWQTQNPSIGYISYGESSNLGSLQNDIRDLKDPLPHIVHFVTLTNLSPQTLYFFKVRSGALFYPPNTLTFKTTKFLSHTISNLENNKPITGVILTSTLSPVDEALVTLHISGVSPVGTLTSKAGNFILPTVSLITADLNGSYQLSEKVSAQLSIERFSQKSQVSITLPSDAILPPIVLGKNTDFTNIVPASPTIEEVASKGGTLCKPNFDLNGDKKVNAIDLTILLNNIGQKKSDKNFEKASDFNCDGVVNQKDVDLLKKSLTQ